jgi:hypothetical protein
MADFKQAFPDHKPFKCCAAWHLHKSGQLLAIYDFLGGITRGGKGEFFSSIKRVAIFFGMNYEATRRAFKVLRKLGFIELLPGDKFGYVPHDEWAAAHPGECQTRELFPWQDCSVVDPIVGEIWKIAGGKIRLVDWQIEAIHKYVGADKFLREFEQEMLAAGLRREEKQYFGTAPKSIFWAVFHRLKAETTTVETHAHR